MQAVEIVAERVKAHNVRALVVDPVLVSTSGHSLAESDVGAALIKHLFPLATVITPNLPEASGLLGGKKVCLAKIGANLFWRTSSSCTCSEREIAVLDAELHPGDASAAPNCLCRWPGMC